MALPGLQLNAAPIIEEKTSVIHNLQANSEWRFEVAFGENVVVKLLSGTAEIFGTELAINQPYTFNGHKAAVYTWHGCRLEVLGKCQTDYTAEETPVASYANLHFALEGLREEAAESKTFGPRVLVVGPENAGKSSLVKLLAAYATRSGKRPVVGNIDTREGMLTVPGTMSAVALESIIDIEEGWGSSPINGPSQIPTKLPLVYYYGLEDPDSQKELSKPLIARLALSVMNRMEDDSEAKQSGCIIDTAGSMSQGNDGYEIIQHAVAEFSITVLVVLGSERLYSEMTRRFSAAKAIANPFSSATTATGANSTISVLKLDKSGGCVDRDPFFLNQMRQAQIRAYFFGAGQPSSGLGGVVNNSNNNRTTLSPHTQHVDFADLSLYRLAEQNALLASLLPGTSNDDDDGDDTKNGTSASRKNKLDLYESVAPTPLMQNGILALLQADPGASQEDLRDASVIGFVYVAEVDEKRRRVRVLAPLGGRLPRKAMVWGQWPEGVGDLVG